MNNKIVDVTYKKFGLKIRSIWFAESLEDVPNRNDVDIVFLHGFPHKIRSPNCIQRKQQTLVSTFLGDENGGYDPFFEFDRSTQNLIRSGKKENVQYTLYDSEMLRNNKDMVNIFEINYSIFAKSKGIRNTFNRKAVESYIEENAIVMIKVSKGSNIFAMNIYVHNNLHVRWLYGLTDFNSHNMTRNYVGKINRSLIYWGMEQFLKNGIKSYDWGGISSYQNPNGVDKFKMQFGGSLKEYYNIMIGNSLKGKLVIAGLKLRSRLR